MATNQSQEAWSDFWALNSGGANNGASNGGGHGAGGCLPQRWAAIEQAQQAAWHGFAADLPADARLLDLATGDGRVLRWILGHRPDLQLIGIDLAPKLPLPPKGTETRGGVAMEDLPFEDSHFHAVTSQFGFEYGNTRKVADEIARVLAPGGKVGLMVHRGDGPILEHNRTRMSAIEWVISEKDIAGLVIKAIETPGAGSAVAAQVAAVIARLGADQFGKDSPAWEIPEALRRACLLGEQQGTESIKQTIAAIGKQAANEVGRIKSLARACQTADSRDELASAFAEVGLKLESTQSIEEPSGRSLADFLVFC